MLELLCVLFLGNPTHRDSNNWSWNTSCRLPHLRKYMLELPSQWRWNKYQLSIILSLSHLQYRISSYPFKGSDWKTRLSFADLLVVGKLFHRTIALSDLVAHFDLSFHTAFASCTRCFPWSCSNCLDLDAAMHCGTSLLLLDNFCRPSKSYLQSVHV